MAIHDAEQYAALVPRSTGRSVRLPPDHCSAVLHSRTAAILPACGQESLPLRYGSRSCRSPHPVDRFFTAWLPGNQTEDIAYVTLQSWNGDELTWAVIARVDGEAWSIFGVPKADDGVRPARRQSAEYIATHTTFCVAAGSAMVVLDFISPMSPKNYLRQSLPFSYLTVAVSGSNGASPDVQIYSDIDNSWAGQYGAHVSTK